MTSQSHPRPHKGQIKIKICGLKTQECIDAAITHGASFLGFVFHSSSPRNLAHEAAKLIKIPKAQSQGENFIGSVAVAVNPFTEDILDILSIHKFDFLQIHGNAHTPKTCKNISETFKINIIRATNLPPDTSPQELARLFNEYKQSVTYMLFDSPTPGSGKKFDWSIFAPYQDPSPHQSPPIPFFIAGGINASNLKDVAQFSHYIDISSGVESERGVKNPSLIRDLLHKSQGISG